MSIFFEVDVTGSMIGYKLSTDPEEAAYALRQMAQDADGDFAAEVADYFAGSSEKVSAFLRKLADAIELAGSGSRSRLSPRTVNPVTAVACAARMSAVRWQLASSAPATSARRWKRRASALSAGSSSIPTATLRIGLRNTGKMPSAPQQPS
jgi:hypothetical protein